MNKWNVEKNFRFESAHRLSKGYKEKCRNIHGHSWNGKVEVSTTSMDQFDMSVDFGLLGKFCKEIEAKLDHACLVWVGDKELMKYLQDNQQAHVVFNENPTCEIIAKEIYAWLVEFFKGNPHVKVESVTINETCTTGCKFTKQPDDPINKHS